jgi:hypothetical protein
VISINGAETPEAEDHSAASDNNWKYVKRHSAIKIHSKETTEQCVTHQQNVAQVPTGSGYVPKVTSKMKPESTARQVKKDARRRSLH